MLILPLSWIDWKQLIQVNIVNMLHSPLSFHMQSHVWRLLFLIACCVWSIESHSLEMPWDAKNLFTQPPTWEFWTLNPYSLSCHHLSPTSAGRPGDASYRASRYEPVSWKAKRIWSFVCLLEPNSAEDDGILDPEESSRLTCRCKTLELTLSDRSSSDFWRKMQQDYM